MGWFARRAFLRNRCPALLRKIFRFPRRANHLYKLAPSRLDQRGVGHRHERWVRDAMDAVAAQDERRCCGRRSRVVLTPRRWRQVSRRQSARRRWQESPVTGESSKETVKTI